MISSAGSARQRPSGRTSSVKLCDAAA
jgi:hypothetical protein